MGAGKLVAARIMGQTPDLDLRAYSPHRN